MDQNNPSNWGRRAWKRFHIKSLYYPDNPTVYEKYDAKNFYELEFSKYIKCTSCKTHYNQIIKQYPIRLESRIALFYWTVDIHNLVNKKLGKPQISHLDAYKLWFGTGVTNSTSVQFTKGNPIQYTQQQIPIPNINVPTPVKYAPMQNPRNFYYLRNPIQPPRDVISNMVEANIAKTEKIINKKMGHYF